MATLVIFLLGTSTGTSAQEATAEDNGIAPPPSDVTISEDGTVELHVVDTPLAIVLRMLSVQGRRNILATPGVSGSVTADLYDVTFDAALKAILLTNDCDYEVKDDFIYVYTNAEAATLRGESAVITTKIFWLNYIRAADVADVVQPLLSPDGTIISSPEAESGIASNTGDAGGDNYTDHDFLAVHDYPAQLAEIGKVIKELDRRPKMVLVEASILRARLSDTNSLGIDFTLVGGVDFRLLGTAAAGAGQLSLGAIPTDRFDTTITTTSTDFAGSVPDGGLTFGIIKDHVAVFLRALEQITDTSVIANPKILALNKQVGKVIVGRRDGYITTTVTQTQAIQKVEFLETGTQLTFRPFIGDDGYVRMELHPEDSVGGLTAAQLPFEQTTEVTTNIIVRDGHTILIGGLFRDVTTDTRGQVPGLGDVPLIGTLFRSRDDKLDREEVIILLTVHIIKNDDDYAQHSREMSEDMERTRVGLRQGSMWHGRERLSQARYRTAVEQLAQGNDSLALWNAEIAVHNYPRFVAAIRLVEKIRQDREWEDDATIGRTFVHDLIMGERGRQTPPFGRPEIKVKSEE